MQKKVLDSKIALVTGASRGIGRAIAQRLASEGAFVILHYGHSREAAQHALDTIEARGGSGALVQTDLAMPGSASMLINAVDEILLRHEKSSALDILVNNAAVAPREAIEDTSMASFDDVFTVNVKSLFFITQQMLPRLRDGGRIINLSSIVTRIGYPPEAAYSMTKGAVDVLTLVLAKQLGPRQITVNSVCPGVIDTDMNRELLSDPGTREFVASMASLGRIGTSDDVASIVAFLASEDARWVTGQKIDASGGSFIG